MLRNCHGVAAKFLRGSKPRLQWLLKTENASLTYAAALATTALREVNDHPDDKNSQFDITDVSKVIKTGFGRSSANAFQAIQVLTDLVEAKKVDFETDIKNNDDFARLLAVIENDKTQKNPIVALKGLKNLLKLGISDDAFVIESLEYALKRTVSRRWVLYVESSSQCAESNLLWNLRKVSVPVLLSILLFQVQHQKTKLQRKVLTETIETIQRRWTEINRAKEIQVVYSQQELFDSNFLTRLDDRTIELAEDMNITELGIIFSSLKDGKRRPTSVLRALAFHMAKKEDMLPPKQISNILYSMHSLHFPDQLLLEKIAKDLLPQVASITNPSVIGAILFSMGHMRWKQTRILEAIAEWVENKTDVCRINELVSLILTLACVAYTPSNVETLFPKIITELDGSLMAKESVWLDVVWSLALLGRATSEHVSSVLDPTFITKCVEHHLQIGMKLKLLNVSAIAKLTMPSYNGPYLNASDFSDVIVTQSRSELALSKHVQAMLHNFFPPPKYIRKNILTSMGIFVDCELAVNEKGKPIPIEDYSDNFGESKSLKPLPSGAMKMAMFVWDYKDYTIGEQELIGVNQLAVQLMEKIGYKVVQVPYNEYSMREKTVKTIKYLENKIEDVALAV